MDAFMQLMDSLGWFANLTEIVGFIVLVLTLINTYLLRTQQQLDDKKITLLLEVEKQPSKSYQLPGFVRRSEFTRAEIMGRLGMIRLKDEAQRFYTLAYVQKNPKFLQNIQEIYDRKKEATMTIYCTESEYNQFDFS